MQLLSVPTTVSALCPLISQTNACLKTWRTKYTTMRLKVQSELYLMNENCGWMHLNIIWQYQLYACIASFAPRIRWVSRFTSQLIYELFYAFVDISQVMPSEIGLNPTCPLSPSGDPIFDCFGVSASMLTLCLPEIKCDWIWQRGICQDRFQSNRRQVAAAKQGLSKMVNTVIKMHLAVLGRKSHGFCVIIKAQMFADGIQTMKTVQHIWTTVNPFFGYPPATGHLWEFGECNVKVQ